jgi:hypothetical protein
MHVLVHRLPKTPQPLEIIHHLWMLYLIHIGGQGYGSTIKEMQSTSRISNQDKTGWMGEEMIFIKDINDFFRDYLYPKEKFLRKNWKEYLPNEQRSLYSVCMKYPSIPEGSNPSEIWRRVIVPSIKNKYQSMRCNMNNKIEGIYMSMIC